MWASGWEREEATALIVEETRWRTLHLLRGFLSRNRCIRESAASSSFAVSRDRECVAYIYFRYSNDNGERKTDDSENMKAATTFWFRENTISFDPRRVILEIGRFSRSSRNNLRYTKNCNWKGERSDGNVNRNAFIFYRYFLPLLERLSTLLFL